MKGPKGDQGDPGRLVSLKSKIFFMLGRGCRQGDPISTYLFALCAEI